MDNHRRKLATAAAFVNATDSRYGFSSKDLRQLGGSELSRIKDLISMDHGACVCLVSWSARTRWIRLMNAHIFTTAHNFTHLTEWSSKNDDCGGIEIRPPASACRIVVQLFWDVAPLACENFATLCANANIIQNSTRTIGKATHVSLESYSSRHFQFHFTRR